MTRDNKALAAVTDFSSVHPALNRDIKFMTADVLVVMAMWLF